MTRPFPARPAGTVAAPLRIEIDVTRWLSVDAESAVSLVQRQPGTTIAGPRVVAGGPSVVGFTVWF